jgi:uncharacterized protein
VKIVVAGGTGLVGRRLVPKLLADGHSVAILTRGSSKRESPNLNYLNWDPEKWQIPIAEIDGCDAIINLAGANINAQKWDENFKRVLMDSRIFSTRCLVKACEKMSVKPKTFINVSAVGFFGDSGDRACVEDSPHGSGFLADLCVAWEREANRMQDLGIRTVIARLGIVLAPDGGALAEMLPIFRWGIGGKLGSGKQFMSWVHIEDAVKAFAWFLNRDKISGTFNVTSPNPVTNKEFTKTLGRVILRPTFMFVPKFVLRRKLGEMAQIVLSGQKVLPQKCMRFGFQFSFPQLHSALSQILKPS